MIFGRTDILRRQVLGHEIGFRRPTLAQHCHMQELSLEWDEREAGKPQDPGLLARIGRLVAQHIVEVDGEPATLDYERDIEPALVPGELGTLWVAIMAGGGGDLTDREKEYIKSAVEVALHPKAVNDCESCNDRQKTQRGCQVRELSGGGYPAERPPDKQCPVLKIHPRAWSVMRAMWLVDHGALRASDLDHWYMRAVQYASVERARLEKAQMEK